MPTLTVTGHSKTKKSIVVSEYKEHPVIGTIQVGSGHIRLKEGQTPAKIGTDFEVSKVSYEPWSFVNDEGDTITGFNSVIAW